MKSTSKILMAIFVLLSIATINAQFNYNAVTQTKEYSIEEGQTIEVSPLSEKTICPKDSCCKDSKCCGKKKSCKKACCEEGSEKCKEHCTKNKDSKQCSKHESADKSKCCSKK